MAWTMFSCSLDLKVQAVATANWLATRLSAGHSANIASSSKYTFFICAFVDLVTGSAETPRADVIMTHDEHARRDVTGHLSMHVICTHKAVKLVLRYFKVLLLFDTY